MHPIEPSAEGESLASNGNGDVVGRGPLGGEGKVTSTGKGKFGMDVKFVSAAPLPFSDACR